MKESTNGETTNWHSFSNASWTSKTKNKSNSHHEGFIGISLGNEMAYLIDDLCHVSKVVRVTTCGF